ncbi:unnamed protein product [Gemmata massiliana]|uniref:Uncharacterized protein n=1 Tax=Gemmata massiliana TaxID=1210884 RepID=A0A6P2CSU6_9BACT|nr:unnamed protein product [Gemmata massiliana]
MRDINSAISDFIAHNNANPLPPKAPTREYLTALRAHLDAILPEWREQAFADGSSQSMGIEVEFWLTCGRKVRGTLVQRPSPVRKGKRN